MKAFKSGRNQAVETSTDSNVVTSRDEFNTIPQMIAFDEVLPKDRRGVGLPDPPTLPGTRVIEVTKVFRAAGFSPSSPRSFPYKIRKVLAFLRIEGFIRTYLKLRSALLSKRLESEEAFVVVVGMIEGSREWCAACGRQFTVSATKMIFREELVFPAADEASSVDMAKKIISELRGNTQLLISLVNLSPFSREQVPAFPTMPKRKHPVGQQANAKQRTRRKVMSVDTQKIQRGRPHLIQIGAGSYPYVYVLPHIKQHVFDTIVDYNPLRARAVANRFGFQHSETDYTRVLERAAALPLLTVVVASYHSLHADIAIDFLEANPNARVLIEKPPIVGYEQLQKLLPYMRSKDSFVEIGYNRRYTNMIQHARSLIKGRMGPATVTCIPREDDMQPSHWSFWSTEGGRVHENLCHWIDLGAMLIGTRPVEVVSLAGKEYESASNVMVRFEDDSILNLISGVIGNGLRGVQEYIDIKTDYITIQIEDFRRMVVLNGGSRRIHRHRLREKGHISMYNQFSKAAVKSLLPRYSLRDFVRSCVLMEDISHMLSNGQRHQMIDVSRIKELEGESAESRDLEESEGPVFYTAGGRLSSIRSALKGARRITLSRKRLWESAPGGIKRHAGRILGFLPLSSLLGSRFRRSLSFAKRADWWACEQARAYQLSHLRTILKIAYGKSEFYNRLFNDVDFDPGQLHELTDIRCLPTINSSIARDNLSEMLTVRADHLEVDCGFTGGTGGKPLSFYMNADRSPVEYSYLVASWERIGYRLGMPMAVLRGRTVSADRNGMYHEYDPILRHHYYSSFHMSDENMARYLDHITTIGSCWLHVYPSTVAAVARFILRNRTHAPDNIRGIIAESEIVYPEQRQMVEEVFGCRYFSCYGHSEKLVLAAECERSNDYHVWPTYGCIELLDDEGNPVTEPGQRGEIVGTGFINTVMPFIRYRTGDWATYVGNRCDACGREHTIIRDIRGHRTQEVLVKTDGSEIPWAALNMHDDTFNHVRQFQFFQETPGQAVLRIVATDEFNDQDAERIQRNLGRKFDNQFTFTIERTDAIPLSPRGKAIYVDQRIQREVAVQSDSGNEV
ncbi:MAG: Gfo/Idh/MocA family oxidoreductase [Planctomycetota bacterium]|jgi:phenylacetate-CoA ligase